MGGRGNAGTRNSNSAYAVTVEEERLSSYNYREVEKEQMRKALDSAKEAIDSIVKDPYLTKNDDYREETFYERLADWFPRAMDGDDAEKIVYTGKDYITTVTFSIHDFNGKFDITLKPASYSVDEFSKEELERLGIEWIR